MTHLPASPGGRRRAEPKDYEQAFGEWIETGENQIWDCTAADGLDACGWAELRPD